MLTKHLTGAFELKELGLNGYVAGYASVFGAVDAQREQVAKGAFTRTLKDWQKTGRQPAMLWMHNAAQPVGVWRRLAEDQNGLAVEGALAIKTQGGADAYELLKMGAVTGLSIGYRTVASALDARNRVRTLHDVDLFEVSLVTFPANDQARIRAVKAPEAGFHADSGLRALADRLKATARYLQN
jgi:HK97 family phage prohead protease